MGINQSALDAEKRAFKQFQHMLGMPRVFERPLGFSEQFPDFGFRLTIDGKTVDLYFEYKANHKAQMSSMRDWIFDGRKFNSKGDSEEKRQLVDMMNASTECIDNGKRLLRDFKEYFDQRVKSLHSGCTTVEPDQKAKKAKLKVLANNTTNYALANISNTKLGDMVVDAYKRKFREQVKASAHYSLCLMVIGKEIFFVDEVGVRNMRVISGIYSLLGVRDIPRIRGRLSANLEVRIQPKNLEDPNKYTNIDTMANFRLTNKPNGPKVLV